MGNIYHVMDNGNCYNHVMVDTYHVTWYFYHILWKLYHVMCGFYYFQGEYFTIYRETSGADPGFLNRGGRTTYVTLSGGEGG
jgi:hypothetical protein